MDDVAGHGAVVGFVLGAKVGVATGPTKENRCVASTTHADLESVSDPVIHMAILIHMPQTGSQAAHEGEESRSMRGGKKVAGGIRSVSNVTLFSTTKSTQGYVRPNSGCSSFS